MKLKLKLNQNDDLMNVAKSPYFGLRSGLVTFVADKHDKWGPFEDFNNLPSKSTIFAMFGNKVLHDSDINNHFPAFASCVYGK